MLLFEELFMLIYECSPGASALAECSVGIGDTVRLITKGDRRIIDLTDVDRDVSSPRAYTLSNLPEGHTANRAHMLTRSYNRNALEIR